MILVYIKFTLSTFFVNNLILLFITFYFILFCQQEAEDVLLWGLKASRDIV